MKPTVRIVAGLAAIAMLAACSSSKHSDGGASPSGTSSSSAGTPSNGTFAAAKAYLAAHTANPEAIGEPDGAVLTPLSRKPDPGKLVVYIASNNTASADTATAIKAATTLLGWKYQDIVPDATAEGTQKAMQSALQLSPKPFAIDIDAIPKTGFLPELAEAKAMGVHILEDNSADVPGTGDGIDAQTNPADHADPSVEGPAAAITVDSKGKGKVLIVTAPALPVLTVGVNDFKQDLTKFCGSGCSTQEMDIQLTDIGSTLPASVVSTIQKDPSIGYIEIVGGFSLGIPAALKAAGFNHVQLAGIGPDTANIAAMKANDGTNLCFSSYSSPIVGYEIVNAMARLEVGDQVPLNVGTPVQDVTPANVNTIVTDSAGHYVGVADYVEQFKKLWKLS